MFTSIGMAGQLPQFQTRKAMIIINLQHDSFDTAPGGFIVCQPQDFVERIKAMLPSFRKTGDLVWVRTEFDANEKIAVKLSPTSSDTPGNVIEEESVQVSTASQPGTMMDSDQTQIRQILTRDHYFPSSRTKAVYRRASAKTRAEQRDQQIGNFSNDDNIDDYLSKPRKGQLPRLYIPGTRGAAFTDDILPYVNPEKDMMLVKHHYSAFDATPLLLTLRMKLVTHIYLCGLLSNVSIYATAADAVRHGFEVTVVEDCMGYRSEAKHLDAMRQMADLLGVSGIDSEEIIDEAGGEEPPDAEVPMFSGPGLEGIRAPSLLTEGFTPRGELGGSNVSQQTPTDLTGRSNESVGSPSSVIKTEGEIQRRGSASYHGSTRRGSLSPDQINTPSAFRDQKVDAPRCATMSPGDKIGEGDSRVLHHALSQRLGDNAFMLLKEEVQWQAMRHRGGDVPRKVAVQGKIDKDGSRPLYRHPADESPPLREFSTTTQKIREELQELLKQPFNHALIQMYRDGQDNISEHSDKTLDIVRGSSIVNLSLGAQRVMTLRTKKNRHPRDPTPTPNTRQSQRIPLTHNSVFVLGPQTNLRWLHGIRPDKRASKEKTEAELAFNGERISITFRHIGTFTDEETRKIWGQGAVSKQQGMAGSVSINNSKEMEHMIEAFGKENQQADFDWNTEYGSGFDVVNLVSSVSQLSLCNDNIANLRVLLSLLEKGVPCDVSRKKAPTQLDRALDSRRKTIFALSGNENPTFRDIDEGSSEIVGDLAILFYLGRFYPIEPSSAISTRQLHRLTSQVFSRVTQANEILYLWQELQGGSMTASTTTSHSLRRRNSSTPGTVDKDSLEEFEGELEIWEEYAEETDYVGGDYYAMVDCAFWPVLNDIVAKWEGWSEQRYPDLAAYHKKVAGMASVKKALEQIP